MYHRLFLFSQAVNISTVTCQIPTCSFVDGVPNNKQIIFNFRAKYIEFNSKMADKQKVDLGLLEEDDEFEEFPAESKFISYEDFLPKIFKLFS